MQPFSRSGVAARSMPSDQDATGRTLGVEEAELATRAILSGTLTSTKGEYVRKLETRFAEMLGAKHAYATSSGSASIHVAVAALDPEPGDEIITTAITDMGALTPILYQGAIPVFADVDPNTGNVTAESVADRIGPRTRAIIVTHLFGQPADMDGIMAVADRHGIPVIEDCAQAFLARSRGRLVGTIGRIGCFSLQQGKHITTGEGGLVVTDDDALARRMFLFINKAWGYGDATPDHYFLALNYRMTELQGAVGTAQLDKLDGSVERRVRAAAALTGRLEGENALTLPVADPGDTHSYWKYAVMVDEEAVPGGPGLLAAELKRFGVASAPRYIQKPAFQCAVFRDRRTFGNSGWPFTLARPEAVDYAPERFPGTFRMLRRVLVLPWNERYSDADVACIADAIRDSLAMKETTDG